jgi:hypothetical protein
MTCGSHVSSSWMFFSLQHNMRRGEGRRAEQATRRSRLAPVLGPSVVDQGYNIKSWHTRPRATLAEEWSHLSFRPRFAQNG